MSHEIAPATMKELRGVLIRWAVVLAAVGAFAIWATWRMSTAASRLPALGGSDVVASQSDEPTIDYWTCTMHPEIQQPRRTCRPPGYRRRCRVWCRTSPCRCYEYRPIRCAPHRCYPSSDEALHKLLQQTLAACHPRGWLHCCRASCSRLQDRRFSCHTS